MYKAIYYLQKAQREGEGLGSKEEVQGKRGVRKERERERRGKERAQMRLIERKSKEKKVVFPTPSQAVMKKVGHI